jgi:membrane peptidoglycan carboxypeptidase
MKRPAMARPRAPLELLPRVVAILYQYFTTAKTIAYDEAEQIMNSNVSPKHIVEHMGFLDSLIKVQPNGVFSQSFLCQAFTEVATQRQSTWLLSIVAVKDFATTLSRRVRAMLRHYMQACSKGNPPAWTGRRGEQPLHRAAGKDQEATEEWFVGYDEEMKQCWRQRDVGAEKEWTNDIYCNTDAEGSSDPVRARFTNGETMEVPDLTVGLWLGIKTSSQPRETKRGKAVPAIWEKKLGSGAEVQIKRRTDRTDLVSMYIKDKGSKKWRQMLQVRVNLFKTGADAEEFMVEMGELFSQDETQNMVSVRNARLKSLFKTAAVDAAMPMSKKPATGSASSCGQSVLGRPDAAETKAEVDLEDSEQSGGSASPLQRSGTLKKSTLPPVPLSMDERMSQSIEALG